MIKQAALAATLVVAATQAHAAATVKTVFVIALENHNFTQPSSYTSLNQLLGDPAAPYLNSLITPGNANAAQVSYASNYHNVIDANGADVHPSEPNYVWAEAGVHGPLDDKQPYPNNIVNAQNLTNLMQQSGQTWRSYQEDIDLAKNGSNQVTSNLLPQSQWTVPLTNQSGTSSAYTNAYNGSHQYDYAAKHDPMAFFSATNGNGDTSPANPEVSHYVPLQQLATDLANNTVAQYNWITPDQFNDMHSTLSGGFTYNGVSYTGDQARIAAGDNFLSQIIPLIMSSQSYKDDGAIVIWNDETEGDTAANYMDFTNTEIVISPLAKGNAYTNNIFYDHSSDLKTMQELFGIDGTQLGGAARATDLADLFKPGAISGVPEPATWGLMLIGFGGIGGALRSRRGAKAVMA